MKNFLPILIFFSLLLLHISIGYGQDSLRSQVFVLSTCEPNSFSMFRKSNSKKDRVESIKSLEVFSNRSNSFQITGINPLRYKYFINNEAVTQFVEASTLTFSINTFLNGDIFNGAPDIKVPEIFKTDSISSKAKLKIQEFKKQNKSISDSIILLKSKISNLGYTSTAVPYPKVLKNTKDSSAIREFYNSQAAFYDSLNRAFYSSPEYKQLYFLQSNLQFKRNFLFDDYQTFISQLPLNNPKFALLEQYKTLNFSKDPELDSIRLIQRKYALDYEKHNENFKKIEKLISLTKNVVFGTVLTDKFQVTPLMNDNFTKERERFTLLNDSLTNLLALYTFTLPTSRLSALSPYEVPQDNLIINTYSIREQIVDKRFQLYEEFVLNIVTKIGVLVQNQFREFSGLNNTYENMNCLDDSTINNIIKQRESLSHTFSFIQKTSAELQILVSYLDINTDLYQNIAKKINNNYVFLLSYLKNLDYLTKVNSTQYTLPTYSNLKNIDVIRYTIKREDKITKNSQTYNYDFWLRGGVKIDFSIALIGSRLTDNVYNKILLATKNGIDSMRIVRQDDGRGDFAFGGMVDVTPRNGTRWLNVGGSIGVAYSGNQRLQFLTSAAFHFGKTERVVAHIGLALGRIKYLDISANDFKFYKRESTGYKEILRDDLNSVKEADRIYMLNSSDIKFSTYTIPTFEKFAVRPFIGISYNLSKKNALQAVSGVGSTTYNANLNNISEK